MTTIEKEIKKRSKEIIPKIKQSQIRAIPLQGAIEKRIINYWIAPLFFILGAPIIFLPTIEAEKAKRIEKSYFPTVSKTASFIFSYFVLNYFCSIYSVLVLLLCMGYRVIYYSIKRYSILDRRIARHFVHFSECLYNPLNHLCNSNN